jgi:hypothetical protein
MTAQMTTDWSSTKPKKPSGAVMRLALLQSGAC